MAAEYEVNIKLNTQQIERELKKIESATANIGKSEKKSVFTADQRTAAMVKLRNVGDQVRKLGEQGLVLSKAELQVKKAAEALDKGNLATVKARVGIAKEEVNEARKELTLEQKITQQLEKQQKTIAASGRGGGGSQGVRAPRRSSRFTDIATGAGFPLLFGGGPVQALAGGIGGAFGGLGGAIAGSAIVSQIEAFGQAAAAAGQAFQSTGGALDFMREKSLFSSAAAEERATVLEELGRVEELATLLTEELTGKIGNEGVRSLQELGKTTDETTRLWSELTTQLFALVSGPLNEFLKIVNQVLGGITTRGRFEAVKKDFAGNKAFEEAEKRVRSKRKRGSLQMEDMLDLVTRAQAGEFGQVANPVQIPVTAADRRRFDVKGTKAANDEERLQKRLGKLEEERKKVLEISRFRDKIAAAEAAEDDELVIRLQGEQRIAEIEASRLKALVGVADQRERDAINIGKATEKLAAHRTTERELAELQLQRQEKFEDTIENLEHQLALATATSEAERERLRIEKELQDLREGGMSESQLKQVGDLMRQISAENSPLNQFIKQSVESLNNLEQHAVQVSQGIGNAIGNSLVNGMQNLVTGAASVKQVFADMLKSIADVLAQQAAQMIATYISIGIAKAFAFGFSPSPAGSQGNPFGSDVVVPGPGGSAVGGGRVPLNAYAEGGYVSGPTRALVGEGGESEYIIPESKMRESMARYSRGARGSAVIPENGGGSGAMSEGGGTAVAAPIDVRYTVERINSVDYVTADQFQAGMRRAANQGAKQGEQQTLKRLQMSSSTRKRVGM